MDRYCQKEKERRLEEDLVKVMNKLSDKRSTPKSSKQVDMSVNIEEVE